MIRGGYNHKIMLICEYTHQKKNHTRFYISLLRNVDYENFNKVKQKKIIESS